MSDWFDWDDWHKLPSYGWSWDKKETPSISEEESRTPLLLYCVYAYGDRQLRDQLEKHLSLHLRWGLISQWHDRQIIVGTKWTAQFDEHPEMASIILLLLSPDFLASDYSYGTEMQQALERHKQGKSLIIPLILRPCEWRVTAFANLQYLPRDGRAVTIWENPDIAFADIARNIGLICREFQELSGTGQTLQKTSQPPSQIYPLYEVFVKSGTPTATFVEPENFEALKQALAQPGRSIVIEGPSGVGKTTAVEKAIESLTRLKKTIARVRQRRLAQEKIQMLSARNPKDRLRLHTLRGWHEGTVIVDDFHRLDPALRQDLADYLKYLADTNSKSQKLVIVGIPQTGQTLVDTSFDLATRIDVFSFGRVSDALIYRMVEKGEAALNVRFERKTETVLAANGSLNIAQFLCFNLCQLAHISESGNQQRLVPYDLDEAQSLVIKDLSRKFNEPIRRFVSMGGPHSSLSLLLLEELSNSKEGFLSLRQLKSKKPDAAQQLNRFLSERWMEQLYRECQECEQHFFFDLANQVLVIDDPQLTFYLKKLRFSTLAKEAGKIAMLTQRKVFVSYSHKDARWLERLRIHLKPLEREGIIDLWDDTKITAGIQWKAAIREALETSKVAILLISADFLASDFIAEHQLPTLLAQAASGGTIILPIIVSPCLFPKALRDFQAVNASPEKPLSTLSPSKQEQVFVKVAEVIMQHLADGAAK